MDHFNFYYEHNFNNIILNVIRCTKEKVIPWGQIGTLNLATTGELGDREST